MGEKEIMQTVFHFKTHQNEYNVFFHHIHLIFGVIHIDISYRNSQFRAEHYGPTLSRLFTALIEQSFLNTSLEGC